MSKTRVCDICDSEINRTYGAMTKKAKKGTGSAALVTSRRRRLLNWLLGPLYRMQVYGNRGGAGRWNVLDLCASCTTEIRQEVSERVSGGHDD